MDLTNLKMFCLEIIRGIFFFKLRDFTFLFIIIVLASLYYVKGDEDNGRRYYFKTSENC